MKRSKIALLERTRDIIMGRESSSVGDSGWVKGAYKVDSTVCLNAALRIAEHDLFVVGDGPGNGDTDWYSRHLATDEGLEAQRILVEAIYAFYADAHDIDSVPSAHERVQGMDEVDLHQAVVAFNDTGGHEEEHMNDVLQRAEKIGYERWLEDHRDLLASNTDARPFVDTLNI